MREIKFRAWCTFEEKMYNNFYIDEHATYAFMHELIESAQERYEIMQYTGLKDAAGREIYEGDIIEVNAWRNKHFVVAFEAGMFRATDGERKISLATFKGEVECCVIGNIYENPELLEGE